jgi:hypothetical protein
MHSATGASCSSSALMSASAKNAECFWCPAADRNVATLSLFPSEIVNLFFHWFQNKVTCWASVSDPVPWTGFVSFCAWAQCCGLSRRTFPPLTQRDFGMRNLCARPSLSIHFHARVPIIMPVVCDPPNPFVALFDSTIRPSKSSIRFETQPVHRLLTPTGTESALKVTIVSKQLDCMPFTCIATATKAIILIPRLPFRLEESILLALWCIRAILLLAALALLVQLLMELSMVLAMSFVHVLIGSNRVQSLLLCDFQT